MNNPETVEQVIPQINAEIVKRPHGFGAGIEVISTERKR